MIAKLSLPLMLLAASTVAAGDSRPKAGSYGFNWLDPDSPCKKLTDKDLKKAPKCTVSNNAFGIELKSHQCKVDERVEWVVYETAAQCQEAHETMQANGP
ncbi:hypothetical protein [Arenimonas sp.]|uniref:hypothetical protein n=1 Tax=Arenimonas sp. TaxID=1872635 RepID=UPI0039E330A7